MHRRLALLPAIVLASALLTFPDSATSIPSAAVLGAPVGTAFTYQGQVKQGGEPLSGNCDIQFELFDAVTGGSPMGNSPRTASSVPVTNGLFTVQLDFGPSAFTGQASWLELALRCPARVGSFTPPLTPRQPVAPTPYALALPGLYTQQNATSPNVIGGYSGNTVTAGVVAGTIGGGFAAAPNRVIDDLGTVGGGAGNQAGKSTGTTSDSPYATVAGGESNTVTVNCATVAGGISNTASARYAAAAAPGPRSWAAGRMLSRFVATQGAARSGTRGARQFTSGAAERRVRPVRYTLL